MQLRKFGRQERYMCSQAGDTGWPSLVAAAASSLQGARDGWDAEAGDEGVGVEGAVSMLELVGVCPLAGGGACVLGGG